MKEKYVLNNKRHKFYILLKQYLRVQLVIGLPWKPSLHWHCPFTHTAYLAHFLLLHNSEIQQFLYHYILYIQNKLMKTNEKISNLGECHTNLMLYRKSFTSKVYNKVYDGIMFLTHLFFPILCHPTRSQFFVWFSLVTLVSSTNKTDCHDITEILLKVALNTITPNP
jgi:hypothetical protein